MILRNEANKSFAINETTIMLRRMLRSNRGAGENAEAAGRGLSGAAGSQEGKHSPPMYSGVICKTKHVRKC